MGSPASASWAVSLLVAFGTRSSAAASRSEPFGRLTPATLVGALALRYRA
jgi:hypothetical protein